MPLFQIRIAGTEAFEVIEDGGHRLAFYFNARQAKAYRNAIDWAINDQGMAVYPATIYASQRAILELGEHGTETEEPDEHFLPA